MDAKRLMGQIFFALQKEADTEWIFIDGSHVRVHQHASGSRRGEYRAIGKTPGGPTTKIHMASDAHGNPLCFEVTGGQVHDSQIAPQLIDQVQGKILIADKGYDSELIREKARSKNMIPIIPKRSNTKNPDENFDKHIYRSRHVIENLFAKLKHYKAIAMRADKLARNFKASITYVCTFLWLKLLASK
jgi:transposase